MCRICRLRSNGRRHKEMKLELCWNGSLPGQTTSIHHYLIQIWIQQSNVDAEGTVPNEGPSTQGIIRFSHGSAPFKQCWCYKATATHGTFLIRELARCPREWSIPGPQFSISLPWHFLNHSAQDRWTSIVSFQATCTICFLLSLSRQYMMVGTSLAEEHSDEKTINHWAMHIQLPSSQCPYLDSHEMIPGQKLAPRVSPMARPIGRKGWSCWTYLL